MIYGKKENISYYNLDLIWKPAKSIIRFVFVKSTRGNIILMCSDLNLSPTQIIELYSYRFTIETMFKAFKNVGSGFTYHFWSLYLTRKKRIPSKSNNSYVTDSKEKEKTTKTFNAIENFVNFNIIAYGLLQLISIKFNSEINNNSNCWLRTIKSEIPSIFVTKFYFLNTIKNSFNKFKNICFIKTIIKKQANISSL